MHTKRSQKLKKVLESVPAGFLVDATWLTTQGIAYESFRDYARRGWLERVCRGVYQRPFPNVSNTNPIEWKTCLLSLQHIMRYDIHVGSTTSLDLWGYSHYLRLGGNPPVFVYGDKIPNWLSRIPLSGSINTRSKSLFTNEFIGLNIDETRAKKTLPWDWNLIVSKPERAIMEAIDELPDYESFHNLDMIFEGLMTMRPRLLSELLHSCRKIKVKRLFFVFADRHNHPWRKYINAQDFNLGSGDRALCKGGKIHPDYRIVVPKEFVTTEDYLYEA